MSGSFFRIAVYCLCFILPLMGSAQVIIEGEVAHDGKPIPDVTIKIYEQGKVVRTLQANRRGRYETEIPFDKQYTLVFMRPFMLPVSIEVDTRLDDRNGEHANLYDVPLNMEMFYRYSGMKDRIAREPIGVIKQTGTGESTFSFVPNPSTIEALKPLHKESLERERKGEGAVESSPQPIDKSTSETATPTVADETETPTSFTPASAEKAKNKEIIDPAMNEANRFEVVESAKKIENQTSRDSEVQRISRSESTDMSIEAHIEQEKKIRSEYHEEQKDRSLEIGKARTDKHEDAVRRGMTFHEPIYYARKPSVVSLIGHSIDEGIILTEERIIVDRLGKRDLYVMSTYDWLLFDYTTFTLNGIEITEEEYEAIKVEVGI